MSELTWDPLRLIRPEHGGDVASVRTLLEAAFARPAEADLVEALRECGAGVEALTLVAEQYQEAIGFVMMSRAAIVGEVPAAVLALAPLAVAPGYQRRGLGFALVTAAHDRARLLGFAASFVLGDPAYYARFGYVPASAFGIAPPFDAPDGAFMALELQPGALAGVTGALRYAPPFDALDAI